MTPAIGRLLIVGCGNMGSAMLRRWLEAGFDPANVTVVSPSLRAMPADMRTVASVAEAGQGFDTILLGLKPQQLDAVRDALSRHAPRLLISILAGVRESTLAQVSGAATIVRAMPNLPVAIGQGVVALHSTSSDTAARDDAAALMAPLGLVEWIGEEGQFDAVTALSGCGPGFVFRFIDALAAAAGALGLPVDQAARLATATVAGAAAMAAGSGESPATLAERVASPGGSTRAGLDVLDRDAALRRLLAETLAAAAARNAAMAAETATSR